MTSGGGLLVLIGVTLALVTGLIPGLWMGAAGRERSRGHAGLAVVVGLVALAGVALYTVGGTSEELFSRVVMLPLTLVIAVAVAAVLVGVPMYASYLFGHRFASRLTRRGQAAADGKE